MNLISDGLLLAGTAAATFYCFVLARRVRGLMDLDSGLGGAITTLSRQVNDMKASVDVAKQVTGASAKELVAMTARAEIAAGRLELLLATLHENTDESGKVHGGQSERMGGR